MNSTLDTLNGRIAVLKVQVAAESALVASGANRPDKAAKADLLNTAKRLRVTYMLAERYIREYSAALDTGRLYGEVLTERRRAELCKEIEVQREVIARIDKQVGG